MFFEYASEIHITKVEISQIKSRGTPVIILQQIHNIFGLVKVTQT